MFEQGYKQFTKGFKPRSIHAKEYPQVLRFISMQQKTIYTNVCAATGTNIIKLAFHDRELLKI